MLNRFQLLDQSSLVHVDNSLNSLHENGITASGIAGIGGFFYSAFFAITILRPIIHNLLIETNSDLNGIVVVVITVVVIAIATLVLSIALLLLFCAVWQLQRLGIHLVANMNSNAVALIVVILLTYGYIIYSTVSAVFQ
jgi:hypothetical protein